MKPLRVSKYPWKRLIATGAGSVVLFAAFASTVNAQQTASLSAGVGAFPRDNAVASSHVVAHSAPTGLGVSLIATAPGLMALGMTLPVNRAHAVSSAMTTSQTEMSATTSMVTGTVTNATTNAAFGGVCVIALIDGAPVAHGETQSKGPSIGSYKITGLAPGSYVIEFAPSCTASASGFSPQYYDGTTTAATQAANATPVAVALGATVSGISATVDVTYIVAPPGHWPVPDWTDPTGPIAQSSPVVTTYDGTTFAAVGSENGDVYVINVATGKELPGWPRHMAAPSGQHVAIESSPAVGFLNGRGQPPSIIVGSGSTWVPNDIGEVEAFSFDGKPQWVFHVGHATGTAIGVISSPAVGDITGNSQQDVVFGSWNHNIYALTPSGTLVPGFPFDNADTIWSSPALFHMPGTKGEDIFIGSDASGIIYKQGGTQHTCTGGFIGDYRYEGHSLVPIWRDCENQTIWSSPAIGTLGDASKPVVVVGTGFYEQPFPSDTDHIFAVYAVNGATVPGWPVTTSGPVFGSPAIGDVGGRKAVVDTSWVCSAPHVANCLPPGGPNTSMVTAWGIAGKVLWSDTLIGGEAFSSPVLTPLQGETTSDVLIGTTNGLYPISGSTGAFLDDTTEATTVNGACEVLNSAAVVNVTGGKGWRVIEACGGPARESEIVSYRLPVAILPGAKPAWPMFRESPDHNGVAP